MEDSMADTSRDDLLETLEVITIAQLRAIRRLRLSPKGRRKAAGTDASRRVSSMEMVYDILKSEGRPVHISAILAAIKKRFAVELDRESVVSAITKRIARHDRFMRTAPNTFALIPDREEPR
jgi:hypothetical protein